MACRSCSSKNQKEFGFELNIHFPGREGLDIAPVLVFPQGIVCLDCGFSEFVVPQTELRRLAGHSASK